MKSAVAYYSYSGNTKQVAKALIAQLAARGEVLEIELRSLDESSSFFAQCRRAFKKTRGKIQDAQHDLSGYDLLFLGTPVWAFGPAPAMNTYLDQLIGIKDKKAVLFTTCGSGAGNERCLNYMQQLLEKKGAAVICRFTIQQAKIRDTDFILAQINKVLRLWPNG